MKRFITSLMLTLTLITPAFAQTLAPGDIPPINLAASGQRGGVTGVLLPANGGSGASAALTNGQLNIGSTGLAPVAAHLTAGSNVTITNGAGSITVAAANTFVPTVSQPTAATVAAAVDNAYLCNTTTNAIAVTLPTAVGNAGHQIIVLCQVFGSTHNVTFASTSSQTINGAAASSLTALSAANKSYTFMSDGANWVTVAAQ